MELGKPSPPFKANLLWCTRTLPCPLCPWGPHSSSVLSSPTSSSPPTPMDHSNHRKTSKNPSWVSHWPVACLSLPMHIQPFQKHCQHVPCPLPCFGPLLSPLQSCLHFHRSKDHPLYSTFLPLWWLWVQPPNTSTCPSIPKGLLLSLKSMLALQCRPEVAANSHPLPTPGEDSTNIWQRWMNTWHSSGRVTFRKVCFM
jgi:hypothetical protein